ncbi:MAG: hypothetical protein GW815_03205 [Candidatus Moranbacteria bacterium]|nr:hypothetical protein [Candidatus Moranbacteria bacterium]OIQ04038.1 MAG: hypothetical protein AUK58_01185 [Candidatus Moranbacteria bacterium CG2_30_41_165]PIW94490.1 MAG: hypothetical protein COZ86_00850 [Candidatus Moranbacteria bacterium CG_4_8_14_3_um_filter_41_13]PIX91522.1 MAG: hypothetical protein COZ27_02455 [Candidatus Moranbacteria bacterium CG_4_10_14_3_um_filter_41_65]HCJ45915.1 hypothetical protein [Candidatus Moranbacteria bacterium]
MNRIRPFLFWLFVVIFLSTTSSVLFYTFGYRFNFERGIFVYTGSISIKSTPEKVDISVDGELIPQKKLGILNQSIHIGGLTPGEHMIEVTAPGYTTWSKKTTIQSGLSTEFWNVLLVKTENTKEDVEHTENAKRIFQSRDKWILAVAKEKDNLFMVDIVNTDTHTSNTVFSFPAVSLPEDTKENIEWSPDNKKLLIPVTKNNEREYFIVDIATKAMFSLGEKVNTTEVGIIQTPRWDPSNKNGLLYMKNHILYRMNTASPEQEPVILKENVKSYNFSGEDIYYLQSDNGVIYRFFGNNPNEKPTQISTTTIPLIDQSEYTLILYDATRLTLREEKTGKLWLYNDTHQDSERTPLKEIAEKDIDGVQFSDDGKKLLFFSKNEIFVYFLRDWEAQPIRMKDTSLQIARFSNICKNIIWDEDYEHVLLSIDDTVKIIEIDHRDKRNIMDLVKLPGHILQILPRTEENFLYFTVKGNTVSRMVLSEKTNIFGL